MSVTVTKHEVQTMIDQARNRIMERMVTKYEVRGAVDNARDRLYSYFYDLEQQQLRVASVRHEQQWRKLISLENRMRSLEGELSALNQNLSALLSQQNEIAGYARRITTNGNDSIAILQRALQQGTT
jgi:hypothetical protein